MAGSSAPEASSQSVLVLAIRRHICPFLFRHHLAVLEEVDAESPAGCFHFVLYDNTLLRPSMSGGTALFRKYRSANRLYRGTRVALSELSALI